VASARWVLVGSWVNLPLWVAAVLAIGWLSRTRRQSVARGALFGAVLCVAFLAAGYQGHSSAAPLVIGLGALSLLGAACGLLLALLGRRLRHHRQGDRLA